MQTKKIILQWPLLILFFFSYGDLNGETRDCDTDHRQLKLNEGDSLQIAIKAMIAIDAKDIKTQIPTGQVRLFISPKFMEGSFPRIPYRLSKEGIGDSPYCSILIDISSMRVSTEKEKTTYTYVPSESGGGCGLNIIASSSGSLGGHTDNSCAPGITKILDLDCRQFGGDILTTDKLQTITNPDFLGVKRGCKKARAATPQTRPGSQQKSAADAAKDCDTPGASIAPNLTKLGDDLYNKARERKDRRELIQSRLQTGNAKDRQDAIRDIREDRQQRHKERQEWIKGSGGFPPMVSGPIPKPISAISEECKNPPAFPEKKQKVIDEIIKNEKVQNLFNEIQVLMNKEGNNKEALEALNKEFSLLNNELAHQAEQKMSDEEILAYDQEEETYNKELKEYFARCQSFKSPSAPSDQLKKEMPGQ